MIEAVLFDWGGTRPRAAHEKGLGDDSLLDLLDVRPYASDMTHMKPHRESFQAVGRPVEAWDAVPDAEIADLSGLLAVLDAW